MQPEFWEQCLVDLQNNFDEQQFNTWVRPLQAITQNKTIKITAPNQYAVDWANENLSSYFLKRLEDSEYNFNYFSNCLAYSMRLYFQALSCIRSFEKNQLNEFSI